MLRVVVENLIANAIRYAGPGSTCRVSVTQEGDAPRLTVADDGAGASSQDVERLFERFYRADTARSSRGTGLGLAIVKHIVQAHGGELAIASAMGRGTTVSVFLPAVPTGSRAERNAATRAASTRATSLPR